MAARNTIALASAASGATLWGTLGPVASLLTGEERLAAGGIRLAIGALTLFVLAGGKARIPGWRRGDFLPLTGGAVGMAGFQFTYFEAVGSSGVAVSTAVGIGLSPILTGIWTALSTQRRPSTGWLAGTLLAAGGLFLLAFGGGATATVSPTGLSLSVLAAGFFSLQAVSMHALTTRHAGPAILAAMFALSSVLLAPITLATATTGLLTGKALACVLYLGVVTSGFAYWLFGRGIRHLGAPTAVTISLLEPAGAAVIAALLLHEHVSPAQWLGIGLICGAITLVGITSADQPEPLHRTPAMPRSTA
jgi:DME family drug/metabolite transporter